MGRRTLALVFCTFAATRSMAQSSRAPVDPARAMVTDSGTPLRIMSLDVSRWPVLDLVLLSDSGWWGGALHGLLASDLRVVLGNDPVQVVEVRRQTTARARHIVLAVVGEPSMPLATMAANALEGMRRRWQERDSITIVAATDSLRRATAVLPQRAIIRFTSVVDSMRGPTRAVYDVLPTTDAAVLFIVGRDSTCGVSCAQALARRHRPRGPVAVVGVTGSTTRAERMGKALGDTTRWVSIDQVLLSLASEQRREEEAGYQLALRTNAPSDGAPRELAVGIDPVPRGLPTPLEARLPILSTPAGTGGASVSVRHTDREQQLLLPMLAVAFGLTAVLGSALWRRRRVRARALLR